jgi:threonine/homoserine/homoserine lactone efflux protein
MLTSTRSGEPETSRAGSGGVVGAFRAGVLTNVLNPKVALFFLALMPQFIEPDSDTKVAAFVALGLTFVATGTLWCLVLAVSAGKLRAFFTRHPRGWRAVSQCAGGLFVLLGLRLAVSRQ